MSTDNSQPPQASQNASQNAPKDARDLLTQLYREIGLSAVAAALQVRSDKHEILQPGGIRPRVKDVPAFLREDDQAA